MGGAEGAVGIGLGSMRGSDCTGVAWLEVRMCGLGLAAAACRATLAS